jgi:two-component system, NarL family, sensor histidine kinase DegS
VELQRLAERSSVAGRLSCDFRSNQVPEDKLSPRLKHELLRIAQEAVHNAARHANPTAIIVTLHWEAPILVLEVKDNGCGISPDRLEQSEGLGLGNMRERASGIGGRFEIRTAANQGTDIIVTVAVAG